LSCSKSEQQKADEAIRRICELAAVSDPERFSKQLDDAMNFILWLHDPKDMRWRRARSMPVGPPEMLQRHADEQAAAVERQAAEIAAMEDRFAKEEAAMDDAWRAYERFYKAAELFLSKVCRAAEITGISAENMLPN
jgi:hypothetical protein